MARKRRWGGNFATFLNGEIFPAQISPPEVPPSPPVADVCKPLPKDLETDGCLGSATRSFPQRVHTASSVPPMCILHVIFHGVTAPMVPHSLGRGPRYLGQGRRSPRLLLHTMIRPSAEDHIRVVQRPFHWVSSSSPPAGGFVNRRLGVDSGCPSPMGKRVFHRAVNWADQAPLVLCSLGWVG